MAGGRDGALKDAGGVSFAEWDQWSRKDAKRYREKEMQQMEQLPGAEMVPVPLVSVPSSNFAATRAAMSKRGRKIRGVNWHGMTSSDRAK